MRREGIPITEIFAKYLISKIETLEHPTFVPDGLKNGWFDSFHRCYESTEKDCHKGADGMWVTNTKTSSDGKGHYINYSRFLWRIEPHYCCQGQPHYDIDKKIELFRKSETKKVLFESGKCSICLEWFEWEKGFPNRNVWGLHMGPVHVTFYEDGKRFKTISIPINEKGWKKELTKFIMEKYKYNPEDKNA